MDYLVVRFIASYFFYKHPYHGDDDVSEVGATAAIVWDLLEIDLCLGCC